MSTKGNVITWKASAGTLPYLLALLFIMLISAASIFPQGSTTAGGSIETNLVVENGRVAKAVR